MKVFFDTEFYEFQPKERVYVTESSPADDVYGPHHITRPMAGANAIQLISLGAVREDGKEFYAENAGFDWTRVPRDHWLQSHVRTKLTGEAFEPSFIAYEFLKFAGQLPKFWAYYADYDWVVLCGLYGRMVDLPTGWPMHCMDLKQLVGSRSLPAQREGNHNALADAKWNKEVYEDFLSNQR